MWPCLHWIVVDVVIAIVWSTAAVRGRLDSGRCVYELTWLIDISFKQQGWSVCDLRVALPFCPDFCLDPYVDSLIWITLSRRLYDHSRFCCPLICLLPALVRMLSLSVLTLSWFCNQAVLAEPDKWHGVWVGGSWDTYVVVLFWYYLRSPHFSWAPAACLSSFCVIWFRGCICSCPPSGTVRGRGSQRQSCLPDHWLCREAQQCQKRIAVCCHRADVI